MLYRFALGGHVILLWQGKILQQERNTCLIIIFFVKRWKYIASLKSYIKMCCGKKLLVINSSFCMGITIS